MADDMPARSWDSVCGDCAHYGDGTCLARYITTGSNDCIAAICLGFEPKEKGDA